MKSLSFFILITILLTACYPMADGQAEATIQTWEDLNGNGLYDTNEPPLPWVTVQMSYERTITNANGEGFVSVFQPGCRNKCWEGETILVIIPPGYLITTPIQYPLTGQETPYQFGFQLQDTDLIHTYPPEQEWLSSFTNRMLPILQLDYQEEGNKLSLQLDSLSIRDAEELYRDIFDVIQELRNSKIIIQQINITTTSSEESVICLPDDVSAHEGMISYTEILATYCQHTIK